MNTHPVLAAKAREVLARRPGSPAHAEALIAFVEQVRQRSTVTDFARYQDFQVREDRSVREVLAEGLRIATGVLS